MSTKRKYANPPVVEALCEVSFAESRWDSTVPGRFFERATKVGLVSEKEAVQREQVQAVLGGASGPSAAVRSETRMRFRSSDRTRVVQVDPEMLIVNQLRPYPTFADWSPKVVEAARLFEELVEAKGVRRVGLRYINRIELPGSRIDLQDWFEVEPRLPAAWQDTSGSFLVRVEKKVESDLGLVLTFGSASNSRNGESRFALDLYAVCVPSAPLPLSELQSVMDKAHSGIESAFESSITDKLRARFNVPTP